MNKTQQYCTFFLNDECFGVEVEKVQEVILLQAFTPVHLAPNLIRGLINLRGQIVVVIDLRSRLEYPVLTEVPETSMIVIMKYKDNNVGFLVDKIGEVYTVDMNDFHSAPETLKGAAKEVIHGSFKLKHLLLKILNVDHLTDFKIAI